MASANTANDGNFISGSFDVTIDGAAYTLDTIEHELPVSSQKASLATGLPKGAVYVAGPEKMSCKINAMTGVQVPSRLVPFALAVHGLASKNWVVTTRKITSANEGAKIRTYNVDIEEWIGAL